MTNLVDINIEKLHKIHRLRWKDLRSYRENLYSAKYRILASGSRGKSGLVEDIYNILHSRGIDILGKVTGSRPKIFYKGELYFIDRGKNPKKFFLDYENAGIIADFKSDIYCFENQTISKYTNGYIHHLFKPHIEVIPNIRLEHAELGESLEELAYTFGSNFRDLEYVIYAEQLSPNREVVAPILREYSTLYGVEFRMVDVPYSESSLPGFERIYLLQELMDIMGLPPLEYHEYNMVVNRILWESKPRLSTYGFYYVGLSKVNDLDTTEVIMDYLDRYYIMNRPVYILAYFRGDRIDRTKFFLPFFRRLAEDDSIAKVILGGMYYNKIKSLLGGKAVEMKNIDLDELFQEIAAEDGFLILTVNGVTLEMDMVREMLTPIEQVTH